MAGGCCRRFDPPSLTHGARENAKSVVNDAGWSCDPRGGQHSRRGETWNLLPLTSGPLLCYNIHVIKFSTCSLRASRAHSLHENQYAHKCAPVCTLVRTDLFRFSCAQLRASKCANVLDTHFTACAPKCGNATTCNKPSKHCPAGHCAKCEI